METKNSTLDNGKLAQLEAVNINFPDKLNISVLFEGHEYQADPKSYQEIISALVHANLPNNFYWVDTENNKVPMNKDQLSKLAETIANKRFLIFDKHQRRKHKIRNATTLEDLFVDVTE